MQSNIDSINQTLLLEPQAQPLDGNLLGSYEHAQANAPETYKVLNVPDERADKFIEDAKAGINTDLRLGPEIDVEIEIRLTKMIAWKKNLLTDESISPLIRQAYRWRINEDIANVYMLRASLEGDMRSFRRWNEYIYGKPNEEVYRSALDWVANIAEQGLTSEHETIASAATRVLDLIGEKRGERKNLIPLPEVFEAVRNDHYRVGGYYALLLAGVVIPTDTKVTNEIGDPILEHVVRNNLQSDYRIVNTEGVGWGVAHSKGVVERPAKYNLSPERFVGLGLGHEIGSHLLERVNGLRSQIALAGIGLDRYELGNEGRAVIREQVPFADFESFSKQVRWMDIIRRHIAISYAMGVGETSTHTSSKTFEFINAIDRLLQAKLTPDDPEKISSKADAKTAQLLLRVLKGTDGMGGAYLKDKVYLEGNVACWAVAAKLGPESIRQGDLGKFDITNPRHISLLQQLGMLPEVTN